MLCACSRTALCLPSLSLARLLALRLPDGSRLKKPSPCLWKIEDFLFLRTGGVNGPYTRGLTASCVRAQSRACFPCIYTHMLAYTSFICTRMRAWAHEHPQTCAHVWCPYVHHTPTRSTLVHTQPCAHLRTRCAATLMLTDHGMPQCPQGARSKAIRSPWNGPGLDELGEATMR